MKLPVQAEFRGPAEEEDFGEHVMCHGYTLPSAQIIFAQ
jgi:hypothetical protein